MSKNWIWEDKKGNRLELTDTDFQKMVEAAKKTYSNTITIPSDEEIENGWFLIQSGI